MFVRCPSSGDRNCQLSLLKLLVIDLGTPHNNNFSIMAAARRPPHSLKCIEKQSAYPMGSSSNFGCSIQTNQRFQPSQIVRLEHETGSLYAEVVQLIESRQSCWVRPLVLALRSGKKPIDSDRLSGELEYYDLRQDSDLLLPLTLFQIALDVEVLPWLTNLYTDDCDTATHDHKKSQGHEYFREFIQQIWHAHPEVFRDDSRPSKA